MVETLSNVIRQNVLIDGLTIPGCVREHKISQYADDTTLFVSNGFSIDQALSSVKDYELGSGSRNLVENGCLSVVLNLLLQIKSLFGLMALWYC